MGATETCSNRARLIVLERGSGLWLGRVAARRRAIVIPLRAGRHVAALLARSVVGVVARVDALPSAAAHDDITAARLGRRDVGFASALPQELVSGGADQSRASGEDAERCDRSGEELRPHRRRRGLGQKRRVRPDHATSIRSDPGRGTAIRTSDPPRRTSGERAPTIRLGPFARRVRSTTSCTRCMTRASAPGWTDRPIMRGRRFDVGGSPNATPGHRASVSISASPRTSRGPSSSRAGTY